MRTVQSALGCSMLTMVALFAAACSAARGSDEREPTAQATAAISEVPTDVNCISLTVTGSRSVTSNFDVTPGQSSVLSLGGLPVGSVIFAGSAYPLACANVTTSSVATWLSDPTPATLVAGTTTSVRLNLHRNGQATVDVNFDDDGGSGTTCNPGFADCDRDPSNGCETALSTVNNCGACGVVCAAAPGAAAACSSGVCISACLAGQADCNGSMADGCETNLTSDASNCGSCGSICPVPAHATAVCVGGVCGIGGCASGFADCNGSTADVR